MTDPGGEELFNEFYADALSECPSDFEIYRSDVEIDSLSEDSYESDTGPPKRQICKICCVPLHVGDCYTV